MVGTPFDEFGAARTVMPGSGGRTLLHAGRLFRKKCLFAGLDEHEPTGQYLAEFEPCE